MIGDNRLIHILKAIAVFIALNTVWPLAAANASTVWPYASFELTVAEEELPALRELLSSFAGKHQMRMTDRSATVSDRELPTAGRGPTWLEAENEDVALIALNPARLDRMFILLYWRRLPDEPFLKQFASDLEKLFSERWPGKVGPCMQRFCFP